MKIQKLGVIFMMSFLFGLFSCSEEEKVEYRSFDEYPVYSHNDLWTSYTSKSTTFRIWSPTADDIRLNIYSHGHGENLLESYPMKREPKGIWRLKLKGDYKNKYYTFEVSIDGKSLGETPGIYAQAVGVNGKRAMVIDMQNTNPEGWEDTPRPVQKSYNDIILYELHVRDMSIHASSGIKNKGKYLGLVECGTLNNSGYSTGIDHMKELGITHVHLLPVFDYHTVDETQLEKPQFNWGYDPHNYNVPEGSYSTDPYNAQVRIKEFKEMVKKLHENKIRVIMDVVYNHTFYTEKSNFNREVPGYYYRQTETGEWSNASGCGNETASERPMMRKFIIESCKYWATEYKIDGFRFDLMGIHDIETLNLLRAELKTIDSGILIYGEGWTGGSSPLPDSVRALKENAKKLDDIALFSDDIRDAIKGSVFESKSRGFASGKPGNEETIKFGVVASTNHPQIDYSKANYSKIPWAEKPSQTIGYVSCHDNNTLFDKLMISCPDFPIEDIKKMHKLANAIVLTSQSIPFLHAGVEMMRTKGGEHNSYNMPDDINQIDWSWKTQNNDIFQYYKGLISLRKNHPAFHMPSQEMIAKHLQFMEVNKPNVVAFSINDNANGDSWKNIIVVYNSMEEGYVLKLPEGEWQVAVRDSWIVEDGMEGVSKTVMVPPLSMMVLFQK
ncbi:MAG: type I pullulanase [Bacteroidales bacterium]|nr:type I pullulanase [Bacteroidales bacterium]MBN2820574.1 type I pullulanase [Bacteroidales bacterium]